MDEDVERVLLVSVTREEILATILKKIDDNKGTLAVDWPGGAFDTASVP